MYLQKITLLNYKNIEQAEVMFSPKLNCFLGDNGAGKTNLLDAIYFLSFTKSFFNSIDSQNIRHGSEMFMVQGKYNRDHEDELISIGFKQGFKKQFKRNQKAYKTLSEHIGLFPLVMISPVDSILILGGSDERRKFMDGVISQYDRNYLDALLRYNRTLLQRNNVLKHFHETRTFDEVTLSVYDEQLAEYGSLIYEKRKNFVEAMVPVFQNFYEYVSSGKEQVVLNYDSSFENNDFLQQLMLSRAKDRASQYTNVGIHKDDLFLGLGDYPIKKLGSQGQTKTYLLALKFAQFEYLKTAGQIKPILLLDDIFDKLDANRVGKIIKLVSEEQFGQIFITDTNREHLDGILGQMNTEYKIFKIDEGKVLN
ncbi:MAG: DNA replication/repair protein RecF [Prolixibacteraceae bacterium]